jgi:hypothetical protein
MLRVDLVTMWMRVVSFTPLPLYPQGKSPEIGLYVWYNPKAEHHVEYILAPDSIFTFTDQSFVLRE